MTAEVSLTIDGVPVTAPSGATVLYAAERAGIEIPHLCYEPALGLPPTSSCRLCLVEVEGARGLVTACSHTVEDGMRVSTQTEELLGLRRMMIELLLSDHPHDCMTCEKAGECALQQYAYELGVRESPYGSGAPAEPTQDGSAIEYDRSKCILCGRCVMLCHDGQQTGAVDFLGRGIETRVGLAEGLRRQDSSCETCGNCLDVCPTGALAYPGARGAGRTWELERTVTTCPYCGVGCTIVLHTRRGRVVRITGEPGLGVSGGRLCVKGRFGFDFLHHEQRLTHPLVRRNGELQQATWDEALDLAAGGLRRIRDQHGPDAIGLFSSAKCTNEENYLMQRFARAVIGTNNIDHCARL